MDSNAALVLIAISGIVGYAMAYRSTQGMEESAKKRIQAIEESANKRIETDERAAEKKIEEIERTTRIRIEKQENESKNKILQEEQLAKEKNDQEERRIRDEDRRIRNKEDQINDYHNNRLDLFKENFCRGRKWLAHFVAESSKALDDAIEHSLRHKQRPAEKAADELKQVNAEKRRLKSEVKFLEYQLRSYEEYFPFLEEYRELILDERIPLGADKDNQMEIERSDPVRQMLSNDEYKSLTETQRNQLALERHLAKSKSNWEIGRLYERYIGYLYEQKGWKVVYQGAIMGFEDFGRDLICIKDNTAKIVQAKYWAREKLIREKHIFQLFGTSILYRKHHPNTKIQAVFYTTTDLSPAAKDVAEALTINVRTRPYSGDYPMIKCNVNQSTKERIYHLPFDQQYDRALIGNQPGECYVKTCQEAEDLGFRRAWRYKGNLPK